MRPAFDVIHDQFLAIERRQFSTQGRFSGGWRPLKSSTIIGKERAGLDPRILHATLRLRRSLTQRQDADHVYETTSDSMRITTRVPYAAFHQRGTRRMAQRRPVELTETHRRQWVQTLQRYLTTGGV